MPATPNPVVDKLLLAKELRRLRDEKGLTQQQVAERLRWSREKVGRIETASTSVSPGDVRRLLDLYEILDTDVLEQYNGGPRRPSGPAERVPRPAAQPLPDVSRL